MIAILSNFGSESYRSNSSGRIVDIFSMRVTTLGAQAKTGTVGFCFLMETQLYGRSWPVLTTHKLSRSYQSRQLLIKTARYPSLELISQRCSNSLSDFCATLLSTMAGNGEYQSSLSVDSSKSQVDIRVAVTQANESKYGFRRREMYRASLAGTVDPYDRHMFLCYKNAQTWPSKVEGGDELPKLLAAALKSRKDEIQGQIRFTLCERRDGAESSDGDVLIFPDMVRYRGLTHIDVDNFVEDVLVKRMTWDSQVPEALTGSHIFVCSHGNRDRRCGVCGPVLIDLFKEEIELRGLKDQVFVSPCSHTGGHKYAGNLIIFSPNSGGKVAGHWYGYVTPDDVPILLEEQIGKGKIVERLWRGQMGSSNEEEKGESEPNGTSSGCNMKDGASCCQGADGFSCCKDEKVEAESEIAGKRKKESQETDVRQNLFGKLKAWAKTWEQ